MADDTPILFDFPTEPVALADQTARVLPVVPLINVVIFPHMLAPLFVGRIRSVAAVEAALAADKHVITVAQRDPDMTEVGPTDLYDIGVEAQIQRSLKMPDGSTSIVVQGVRRVQLSNVSQEGAALVALAVPVEQQPEPTPAVEALYRTVLNLFERAVKLSPTLEDDVYLTALNITEPGWLADLVCSVLPVEIPQRQHVLSLLDVDARLRHVAQLLGSELDVLELQEQIQNHVQSEIDRSQREMYLREQLRAIQRELGNEDPLQRDLNSLREKVDALHAPVITQRRAREELERLAAIPPMSPEYTIVRTYLDWLVALPWETRSPDASSIATIVAALEQSHYGLNHIKERIVEFLAVRQLAGEQQRTPILCFVGPPGVGKTSLGQAIAAALERRCVRVSLGGVRDEAEIRGHRRTYIGAMPGRIIKSMKDAGVVNPVIVLDEVDKLGMDVRGDPAAALLEVLDPEQHHAFHDHYLDIDYDLSRVLFIATANTTEGIPPALLDRMEVITLEGYTEQEKLEIARRFLVPRQLVACGLTTAPPNTQQVWQTAARPATAMHHGQQAFAATATRTAGATTTPDSEQRVRRSTQRAPVRFGEQTLLTLMRGYTREAGVRNFEREIGAICRKLARRAAEGRAYPHTITPALIGRYLGPARYTHGRAEQHDAVGVVLGMTWTPTGGDVIGVEVSVMEGRGRLLLTGRLGEVMRESAQAALSYARTNAEALGISHRRFERLDLHIHVPEGAVAKDGPSAGVALSVALISALSNRAVRRAVALTGEVTLRGRVLPVGGLKEKVLGAHRAGVREVILPRANEQDLNDIPDTVRRALTIHFIDQIGAALEIALVPLE